MDRRALKKIILLVMISLLLWFYYSSVRDVMSLVDRYQDKNYISSVMDEYIDKNPSKLDSRDLKILIASMIFGSDSISIDENGRKDYKVILDSKNDADSVVDIVKSINKPIFVNRGEGSKGYKGYKYYIHGNEYTLGISSPTGVFTYMELRTHYGVVTILANGNIEKSINKLYTN